MGALWSQSPCRAWTKALGWKPAQPPGQLPASQCRESGWPRTTGQKGNAGARGGCRRVIRPAPVLTPGPAWDLRISGGRNLRQQPAPLSPGAQVCSALAYTIAWSLPPSPVSSLDPSPLRSSPSGARNCPSNPPTPAPCTRSPRPSRRGLQCVLSVTPFPGSGFMTSAPALSLGRTPVYLSLS